MDWEQVFIEVKLQGDTLSGTLRSTVKHFEQSNDQAEVQQVIKHDEESYTVILKVSNFSDFN
ncbi:hypothetical protein Q9251_03050 [Alkalihalobacillus macyae]|uniref:hypothetical protein n=1 Tax=Guptibacillus hwajinpoensis TaxID=208199 RepID=UPI00273AB4D6|nr:hypothetical protein [Alkalihalobacillus macyae]MDP4549853.1 hypothetical protein [Alkalihalobacillus macyae]